MENPQRSSAKRWRERLEVLAYIAVIATCAVILAEKGLVYLQAPETDTIAQGDQFDALQPLVPDEADQAFVLVLSPTCQYCAASMPAFKKLVEQRNQKNASVAIVAAIHVSTPLAAEQQVLDEHNVAVDDLVQLDSGALKIRGVPTTLLINKAGEVLEVWSGQMTEARAEELIDKL